MSAESFRIIQMVSLFVDGAVEKQATSTKFRRVTWSLPVGAICSKACVQQMLEAAGYDDIPVEYEMLETGSKLRLTIPLYYEHTDVETLVGGAE